MLSTLSPPSGSWHPPIASALVLLSVCACPTKAQMSYAPYAPINASIAPKSRLPIKLVYYETYASSSETKNREYQLKRFLAQPHGYGKESGRD